VKGLAHPGDMWTDAVDDLTLDGWDNDKRVMNSAWPLPGNEMPLQCTRGRLTARMIPSWPEQVPSSPSRASTRGTAAARPDEKDGAA